MTENEAAPGADGPRVLDRWIARKVPPDVLLKVVLVFLAFIALALFVFHSREAVVALAMTGVGVVMATVPSVLEKLEYRATASALDKRTVRAQRPAEFTNVFSWGEIERVVPLQRGFKYFKPIAESNRFLRFWKKHLSDRYSGEVHVERPDLQRVLALVAERRPEISW